MRKLQELVPNMDKVRLISTLNFGMCIYNSVVVVGNLTFFFMLFLAANQHSRHVGLGC